MLSCADDSWKQEIEEIKAELANQKALIEALQQNATITSIEQGEGKYTIHFSDGQSITLSNGKTPIITIGENGNWYIDGVDTGKPSKGEDGIDGENGTNGIDGKTPTIVIGENGNWIINGTDTGIKAEGINGENAPHIINIVENNNKIIFYFSNDTQIEVVKKSVKEIIAWGDSFTLGYVPILNKLINPKYTAINCAVGGEKSLTIAARQGGIPMALGIDVQLSSFSNEESIIGNKSNSFYSTYDESIVTPLLQGGNSTINNCIINDIECVIKWTGKSWNDPDGKYTIKRITEGNDIILKKGSIIYTSSMRNKRNKYANIFYIGANGGFQSDGKILVEQYKKMIEFSGSNNYIVIGYHKSGTTPVSKLREYEKALLSEFGARFLNFREYITSQGLKDAGITPTDEDIEAMNEGKCPPSLLSDGFHLNNSGNKLLATQIYNKLKYLNIIE